MIRVAVVGCGRWGPNHIRNINSAPGARVVVAVDSRRERLEHVAQLFPDLALQENPAAVLADPEVDAVVVATPTSTHYELVRAALDAGKHVLCEKPLCERASDARQLVALAQSRGRVLMTGHVFLFNPGIVRVKEIIESGELGSLNYLAAVRTNLGPIRSDVSVAFDLASHDVSIFNWLLDAEPEMVSAMGGCFLQPGLSDVAFISLRYPQGVVANVQASWLNPRKVRQLTVVGTKRMATWDDLSLAAPVAVYDCGARASPDYRDYGEFLRISMWDGEVRLPKVKPDEPLRAQDHFFVEAVRTGRVDRSGGEFAVGVVTALEAIERSLNAAGSPVRTTS